MTKAFGTLAILFFLTGCGARQAQPPAESTGLDDRLSCAHIQGELAANQARLPELARESERRGADNAGMLLLMGLGGWPSWTMATPSAARRRRWNGAMPGCGTWRPPATARPEAELARLASGARAGYMERSP
ncbi:hypothetical protein [Falsiroseomonas sp.]|uniref:hypothetical protein n=1 Tax=Falsiroseomonas sp. TaxID=2870721 RepID=UPI003F708C22